MRLHGRCDDVHGPSVHVETPCYGSFAGVQRAGGGGGAERSCVGSDNRQTTPATTSTAPVHQRLGSASAETTAAGAQAVASDRTQHPDAACEGKNG